MKRSHQLVKLSNSKMTMARLPPWKTNLSSKPREITRRRIRARQQRQRTKSRMETRLLHQIRKMNQHRQEPQKRIAISDRIEADVNLKDRKTQ